MNNKIAKLLLFADYYVVGKTKSSRIGYIPFYPDNRKIFSRIKILKVVADELAKKIRPLRPDLIASREATGVPFGVMVAARLNKNFLYLRKKPKGYNTKNTIEGFYKPGQKVMVVDDAMSTGKDKKKIVKTLEKSGLKVLGVALFLDAFYGPKYRRSQTWLRQGKKYKFISLITWPELMNFLAKEKFISRQLADLVINYIYDPFVWQKKPSNWKFFKKLAKKEEKIILDRRSKQI